MHGNETSSSEATIYTMHALVTEYQDWLTDVVVIIDPVVNPDGRDRYVNWNKMVTGAQFNPVMKQWSTTNPGQVAEPIITCLI